MRTNQLVLDTTTMFRNNYLAVERQKNYSYSNGVRSDIPDGEKLIVVCPAMAFEKIIIKLPLGATAMLGEEMPSEGLPVTFDNLIVNAYISNGNLGLSAKADSVRLASGAKNEQAKQ